MSLIAEVHCANNASVSLKSPDPSSRIQNNGCSGVRISSNSYGQLILPPDLEISGNSWEGVAAYDNASLHINGGKVQGNGMSGVVIDEGSMAYISGVTISGNTGGDVALRFGARGKLNGNSIEALPITCDGTTLCAGDVTCAP